MKVNIDWVGLLKAVGKSVVPFLAGAFGGLTTGCCAYEASYHFFA